VSRAAPQQQRSKDTVEKILVAADTLFAARGSVGVTTTAIAEEAGISVGALYRFFPDKHAIGQALADRYLDDAAAAFATELASVDALSKVPDGLRRVIRVAGHLALAHPGYYRLTQEVRPEAADSVGHSVRTTMIETFDALLAELGSAHDPVVRRVAVRMTIETVRHTLATCPTSEPERSMVLHELEDMVVTYAERRLTDTP
jgi:AcrR family transcriptional regulator